MPITFVNSDTGGADDTNYILQWPTVQAGDLALLGVGGGGGDLNVTGTYSFTLLQTNVRNYPFAIHYRVCTGAETGNINVSGVSDGSASVLMIFRGVHIGTGTDFIDSTEGITESNSTSGAPDAGETIPDHNNACIVVFAASNINDSTPGTVTNYTAPTEWFENVFSSTSPCTTAGVYRILTGNSGVSQDPAAFSSWSSAEWTAFTIPLREAVDEFTIKRWGGVKFMGDYRTGGNYNLW